MPYSFLLAGRQASRRRPNTTVLHHPSPAPLRPAPPRTTPTHQPCAAGTAGRGRAWGKSPCVRVCVHKQCSVLRMTRTICSEDQRPTGEPPPRPAQPRPAPGCIQ